ncbi:Polysaccharide pyruvyl transferase [Malonomonas rubra DSM 5091]|uniref:Polysaccharide pyruvyl transferase n=1 Tax=Malonomonas rubra DSM 5091 TaxID=1122189 RepID=A0A1M6MAD0_MALRU|nr:polysaccharide pyruvyl transferase family protein [Malonomonas rubra]SHJ80364.1 Polysaccharide pyruvyl transferase [Malonomonas rubra DSM 5091]
MINLYSIRPKGFNVGNDVIFVGLNHFIRQAFPGGLNIIALPATGKYEAQKKAGLSSQTVYEINQFGDGVIVGGGNLYENGELEINSTALKALERPLMIFSVSRGKIYNKELKLVDRTDVMTDSNIALINQHAAISLSRDHATHDYVNNLGGSSILGGCPTLFLDEVPQHEVQITDEDRTDALISIRTPTLMSIPVGYQYELRGQMAALIELLRAKGYRKVKILCHDHRDIPFAASFDEVDYLYTEDVFTYLSFLRNTRLNLTFRLHSFIPCVALGVPAIKISYDQRALSMLDTLGMDQWNINLLTDNLLQEVENRIDNLGDLDGMVQHLRQGRWADLRQTLVTNCARFAEMICERK